jgi:MraZ protein
MFRGYTALSLDAKGRMAIPSRYRDKLLAGEGNQVIVTLDHRGHCLLLYSLPEWEVIEERLVALPTLDETAYQIKHALLGHATECDLDGQGRILLPAVPRALARLDRQVALVGLGNKFEIWDEAAWTARRDAALRAANAPGYVLPDALRELAF